MRLTVSDYRVDTSCRSAFGEMIKTRDELDQFGYVIPKQTVSRFRIGPAVPEAFRASEEGVEVTPTFVSELMPRRTDSNLRSGLVE